MKMIEVICCYKNFNFSIVFGNFLVSCTFWESKPQTVTKMVKENLYNMPISNFIEQGIYYFW